MEYFKKTTFGNLVYYSETIITEDGKKLYPAWSHAATGFKPIDVKSLHCPMCDVTPTKDGHDPCIANLPGVNYACCGHGVSELAYISFEDGTVIRGYEAVMEKVKEIR